jgi:hypothetical protein
LILEDALKVLRGYKLSPATHKIAYPSYEKLLNVTREFDNLLNDSEVERFESKLYFSEHMSKNGKEELAPINCKSPVSSFTTNEYNDVATL